MTPTLARPPGRAHSAAPSIGRVETVAALSVVASGMHLYVMDPHLREWWAYGAFFLACAVGQAALAVLVLRSTSPWLLLTGIVGNVAILGMYVLSRTNGPPLGPHAGRPEEAGTLDVSCAVVELATVIALVGLLPERARRRTTTLLALIGLALWSGRLTGMLL
jgi:hypothetical protein